MSGRSPAVISPAKDHRVQIADSSSALSSPSLSAASSTIKINDEEYLGKLYQSLPAYEDDERVSPGGSLADLQARLDGLDRTSQLELLSKLLLRLDSPAQTIASLVQSHPDQLNRAIRDAEDALRQTSGGAWRDWNGEFRELLSQVDSLEKWIGLSCLGQDLLAAVDSYGRVIIGEVGLPFEAKSVRPRAPGSNEYVCQGLLFELMLDSDGRFRGNTNKMKYAGHVFKSAARLFALEPSAQPRAPLVVQMDLRGFRMLVRPLLTASARWQTHSLRFGWDASRGAMLRPPAFEAQLRHVAAALGLSGPRLASTADPLPLAPGIRLHEARDGSTYVGGLEVLLPPEASEEPAGTFDTRRFRAELAERAGPLLCSSFPLAPLPDDAAAIRQQSERLHRLLLQELLPQVARSLDAREPAPPITDVLQACHRAGINYRHLGRLRALCTRPALRELLLTEVLARTLKDFLEHHWREAALELEAQHASAGFFRFALLQFSELALGRKEQSGEFFSLVLRDRLERKFPLALGEKENVATWAGTGLLERATFRMFELAGVRLSEGARGGLTAAGASWSQAMALDEADLELGPRIKQLPLFTRAQGFATLLHAMHQAEGGKDASHLRAAALAHFDTSLGHDPSDDLALVTSANILADDAERLRAAGQEVQAGDVAAMALYRYRVVIGGGQLADLDDHARTRFELCQRLAGKRLVTSQ